MKPNIKLASQAHPGDDSAYIPGEAAGAIPNGSEIIKVNSEPGDSTPNGTSGKVVSSIAIPLGFVPEMPNVEFYYFVEWSNRPDLAVVVMDYKIQRRNDA